MFLLMTIQPLIRRIKLDKKEIVTAFAEFIEKHFGASAKQEQHVEVTKSLDTEKRMALFVVLSPDEIDGHDHTITAEEIEKACNDFNEHCNQANLFHRVQTENAKIVQSFVNMSEFDLEDGRTIKKGAWLQWWKFPEGTEASDTLWDLVKSGEINGVSIGCKGIVEDM
jgi:hypothetical protein